MSGKSKASKNKATLVSMTGFGRAVHDIEGMQLIVEARSVNGRFLDCIFRASREYLSLDPSIRKIVSSRINRGRVEVALSFESVGDQAISQMAGDEARFASYLTLFEELLSGQGLWDDSMRSSLATDILLRKDVISDLQPSDLDVGEEQILKTVDEAVKALRKSQEEEGNALHEALEAHHHKAKTLVEDIQKSFSSAENDHFEKLKTRLNEFLTDVDISEERIIAEAAVLSDKADISEEIVRLKSHLDQFLQIMKAPQSGRKLDFLLQEFLREANTIASKVQNATLQHQVVELKSEIERMKEQVQNVE